MIPLFSLSAGGDTNLFLFMEFSIPIIVSGMKEKILLLHPFFKDGEIHAPI